MGIVIIHAGSKSLPTYYDRNVGCKWGGRKVEAKKKKVSKKDVK